MEKNEILKIIEDIIVGNYCKDLISINEDTLLGVSNNKSDNSLDLTSIEIVEFIVDLETSFSVIIDFDVYYETVGDVVNDLYERLKVEV